MFPSESSGIVEHERAGNHQIWQMLRAGIMVRIGGLHDDHHPSKKTWTWIFQAGASS